MASREHCTSYTPKDQYKCPYRFCCVFLHCYNPSSRLPQFTSIHDYEIVKKLPHWTLNRPSRRRMPRPELRGIIRIADGTNIRISPAVRGGIYCALPPNLNRDAQHGSNMTARTSLGRGEISPFNIAVKLYRS